MAGENMQDPQDQPISELETESGGFAAYDKTLERFVGGVHRGTGAKRAAGSSRQAKAARDQDHDVEVRAV